MWLLVLNSYQVFLLCDAQSRFSAYNSWCYEGKEKHRFIFSHTKLLCDSVVYVLAQFYWNLVCSDVPCTTPGLHTGPPPSSMLSYQQQQHLLRRGSAPIGQVSFLTHYLCVLFCVPVFLKAHKIVGKNANPTLIHVISSNGPSGRRSLLLYQVLWCTFHKVTSPFLMWKFCIEL